MSRDVHEGLILRHLEGETSQQESAQVTQLLREDADFRSRFFTIAGLITEVQEVLSLTMTGTPVFRPVPNGSAAMLALKTPKPPRLDKPVGPDKLARGLTGTIDFRRIYFNAVLGGTGGLLGWLVFTLFFSIISLDNPYIRAGVTGTLVGTCIGFAIGSVEGLLAFRSLKRLFGGAGSLVGAGLGAVGGCVGLVLAEFILSLDSGGTWPSIMNCWLRAGGWAVFGMFVGTSDGFALKMPVKVRYGILGGLLGGMIGGSTFEVLIKGSWGLNWGGAIGLILLGACIGALIGLVESLLRKAWLFFITGRLEGQTRTLDSSREHTLGSDPSCSIVLLRDPTVMPVHAEIGFSDGVFVVQPRDGKVILRRDGRDSVVTSAQPLQPGDRIHLGQTKMVFRKQENSRS
jgi:hypothetical protein